MSSQRVGESTQDLYGSKPIEVPKLKEEVDTVLILNPEAVSNSSLLAKKIIIFTPIEFNWVYKPHLRKVPYKQ